MALYVTRAALEINGAVETNFKSFTEKSRVMRKMVPLMYHSGTANLTQRYQVELDYVWPAVGAFDFDQVQGGTLTVEYDDGTRVDFGGVSTLETGDVTVDGENEKIVKVTLGCETRNGATGA
jgi:hypothetical protein